MTSRVDNDWIMQGWTKLGTHAHSSTSVLLQSSFQVNVALVHLSLQSAIYSCPRRPSWFLESVATTRTTTTLAYNTQVSCHSAHLVPCLTPWESTTPVYLAIYGCCRQQFLCHHSYTCISLVPRLRGRRETAWYRLLAHAWSFPEKPGNPFNIWKLSVKSIRIRPIYFRIMERYSHLPVELPSTPWM